MCKSRSWTEIPQQENIDGITQAVVKQKAISQKLKKFLMSQSPFQALSKTSTPNRFSQRAL